MRIDAIKLQTAGPSDVSQLKALFNSGAMHPENVICIIGKTEGNGGRNDFTRELAMFALEELFSEKLKISRAEVTERIIFSFSGGCEGVVSPHMIVFTKSGASTGTPANVKRLAVGIGFTREFKPEEIGRMAQIDETAKVIRQIVEGLKVQSDADVHLIQMKGAIPTFTFEEEKRQAKAGKPILSNMVHSRAASALGAAIALGEVNRDNINDDTVCSDWSKFSTTSSCSAKPGLARTEIMVMANSPYWQGDLQINHSILQDMLDTASIVKTLAGLGIDVNLQATAQQSEKIVGVFAKSEADPRGFIRGKRHTMLTDDDISDTRYSRCVLSSVLASVIGDTAVYVSTRAEHHGPLGGGNVAIIARV